MAGQGGREIPVVKGVLDLRQAQAFGQPAGIKVVVGGDGLKHGVGQARAPGLVSGRRSPKADGDGEFRARDLQPLAERPQPGANLDFALRNHDRGTGAEAMMARPRAGDKPYLYFTIYCKCVSFRNEPRRRRVGADSPGRPGGGATAPQRVPPGAAGPEASGPPPCQTRRRRPLGDLNAAMRDLDLDAAGVQALLDEGKLIGFNISGRSGRRMAVRVLTQSVDHYWRTGRALTWQARSCWPSCCRARSRSCRAWPSSAA